LQSDLGEFLGVLIIHRWFLETCILKHVNVNADFYLLLALGKMILPNQAAATSACASNVVHVIQDHFTLKTAADYRCGPVPSYIYL
jgi:hypothetical protein